MIRIIIFSFFVPKRTLDSNLTRTMHRIVYVGEKGAVVDCNFWGELKRPRKNRGSMGKD